MKTRKINLPQDQDLKATVLAYLSRDFSLEETFDSKSKTYAENMDAREHEKFNTNQNMQKMTFDSEANVAWDMFLLLVVGIKGAAFYLASYFINGYGTIANKFLESLTIAIGLKLGDHQTKVLMEDEQPISQNIQKCADQCISKITKNSKKVSNKTNLTYEELIGFSLDFDELVKTFGHSYYDNIKDSVMKNYANFVEIDGNNPDAALAGANDSSCNCILL